MLISACDVHDDQQLFQIQVSWHVRIYAFAWKILKASQKQNDMWFIFIIWNHQTLPENFVPRMDKLGVDQHKPRCPKVVFGYDVVDINWQRWREYAMRLGVVTSLRRGFRRSCKTSGCIRRDEILIFYESPHHVEERCAHQNDAQKSLPVFNVFCWFEW